MYSGFQSNAFQGSGFQIARGGVSPVVDTHDGYTDEDIRKWKKYLKDLKEFKENHTDTTVLFTVVCGK